MSLYHTHHQLSSSGKNRGLIALLIVGVLIGMTGLFLMHTNSIATEGFSLRAMEYQHAKLEQQISRLQVQIATAKSLTKVKEIIPKKEMVAVGTPIFINRNSAVAINF